MSQPAPLHAHAQSHDTHADFKGAHGFVFHVETLGKGVAAILVAAVIICVLLSGMAIIRAESMSLQLEQERAQNKSQLEQERARNKDAENELRDRFSATETESRMAEYYILELDGKLMAGGFIPPSRGYGQWKKEHKK